jgi:hypothetical protein
MLKMIGRKQNNHIVLKTVGSIAIAALAVGIVIALPDIKRYIRLSNM